MRSSTSSSENPGPDGGGSSVNGGAIAMADRPERVRESSPASLARPTARQEMKVVVFVLAAFALLEIVSRILGALPQHDQKRLHEFPGEARRLATQSGFRVVLVGDSLTRNAWDADALAAELNATGAPPIALSNAALYGSTSVEWYYLARTFLADHLKAPAVIIFNASPGAAEDGNPLGYRLHWLARETRWGDVPELFGRDLDSFEQWGEYLHARLLATPMQRANIQAGVFLYTVPHLQEGRQWVNDANYRAAAAQRRGQTRPASYARLERMMAMARERGLHVIVLALPVQKPYDLDNVLIDTVARAGMTFLDVRNVPGLVPAHFQDDGWHMTADGAVVFSRHMARLLPEQVKRMAGRK